MEANEAKAKARAERGESPLFFNMKKKDRKDPSAWTFVLPAEQITSEIVKRVDRKTGLTVDDAKANWTKLTLPSAFGRHYIGVVRCFIFKYGVIDTTNIHSFTL